MVVGASGMRVAVGCVAGISVDALAVECSVNVSSTCCRNRCCSCGLAYLQHGSITCPDGAWCNSKVCVPSGSCDANLRGPGPVKCSCMLRKSIIAPILVSVLSPSSAGSCELLIVGAV